MRSTSLSDETITTKRSAAAATIFSRVCAPPPPFTIQPSRGDLIGAVHREVEPHGRVVPPSSTTSEAEPAGTVSVAGDVATQGDRARAPRTASTKRDAVEPVPRPSTIPLSTSSRGRFRGELLLALDVRGHDGGQLYSAEAVGLP